MLISTEVARMLDGFLNGTIAEEEFESWLVSVTESECFFSPEIEKLNHLRMLITAVGEGTSSLDEVREYGALIMIEGGASTTAGSGPGEFSSITAITDEGWFVPTVIADPLPA
jgi:hypothetical protein